MPRENSLLLNLRTANRLNGRKQNSYSDTETFRVPSVGSSIVRLRIFCIFVHSAVKRNEYSVMDVDVAVTER